MPTVANDAAYGVLVPLAPHSPSLGPARVRAEEAGLFRVRVWDLPTRVFHWTLAASLVGLAATGYAGGAWMEWHARLGSAVLTLLLFRLVWGVVGGRWSRFRTFLPTPSALFAYVAGKGTPEQAAGHSPLGALSVFAMLGVLALQVGTGLVSDDGGGYVGPLNALVSSSAGLGATLLHKQVGQWLLAGLVLLHVVAIVFYRVVRRRKLVAAMVDGDKLLEYRVAPARDDAASRIRAAGVLCICIVLVGWLVGY